MEMTSSNGTQEQALLATNAEKIQLFSYYEIDHKHLPSWIPTELYFRRIAWVIKITEVDVKIRYPTTESLKSYFSIERCAGHPWLDSWYHIKNEIASKVLFRKVERQEFEEKKHTECFWQANLNRPQVIDFGIPKPEIKHKLMEEKRLKLGSPVFESKTDDKSSVSVDHVQTRIGNLTIQPTSRIIKGSRRSFTIPKTRGASHSTRKKVTPKAPKVEDISQACEDKNHAFIIALSDSEDDIVVVSGKQRSQVMSSAAQTSSIKRKNLSPRNEGLHRNKKSATLQQATQKSVYLSDEKMQQIINELLNIGISQSDVGKAAEFCYNDPAKPKVLFALPSHMRSSYVLGFLYPKN